MMLSWRCLLPGITGASPPFLRPLSSTALPLRRLRFSSSSFACSLEPQSAPTSPRTPPPELTVKEKKELASYAHSLGDKLKSQQIGKSGVTPNVIFALGETLESNELLKLKIHRSCPGEVDEIVEQLELGTGSVAVARIGRVVVFYRPSLSKLKAVEKKKQARNLYLQAKAKLKLSPTPIQGSREGGSRRRSEAQRD